MIFKVLWMKPQLISSTLGGFVLDLQTSMLRLIYSVKSKSMVNIICKCYPMCYKLLGIEKMFMNECRNTVMLSGLKNVHAFQMSLCHLFPFQMFFKESNKFMSIYQLLSDISNKVEPLYWQTIGNNCLCPTCEYNRNIKMIIVGNRKPLTM